MRFSFLTILLLGLFSHRNVLGQDQLILVPNHNIDISFAEFIVEIEGSRNVRFFYLDEWVENVTINKSYKGQLLLTALEDLLQGREISFKFLYDYAIVLVKDTKREIIRDELISKLSLRLEHKIIGDKKIAKWGQSVNVSGRVIDEKFSEPILGTAVFANEEKVSVTTDEDGEFILNLPIGKHIITISSLNYTEKHVQLFLYEKGTIDIILEENPITLDEVVIEDKSAEENFNNSIGGATHLTAKSIQKIPTLLGEVDAVKTIQLLPGVTTIGEGSAGFSVRGGSADQNLILLDNTIIFNPTHLFGFFSAFHPDALRDVTFYRGAIPSNFGGRISSVLDIKQKDGDLQRIKGSGGIGIVSSRLLVEGPILKDKISFMLAGRSSYSDWILKSAKNTGLNKSSSSFYDVTGKLSGFIDENNKLTASYYLSNDKFQFANDTIYNWQNRGASLNYEHVFNNSLSFTSSFSTGTYQYEVNDKDQHESFSWRYGIDNLKINSALNWSYKQHQAFIGADLITYSIKRGKIEPLSNESSIKRIDLGNDKMRVVGFFINDEYKARTDLTLNAGLRLSIFDSIGPHEEFVYSISEPKNDLSIIDTLLFDNSASIKQYTGLEPRLSLKYDLDLSNSFKIGYSRSYQYIHLVSNTTAITPVDVWIPSSTHIKPQIGSQFSFGFFRKLSKIGINSSVELFYKHIENVPEYKNGAELVLKGNIETELVNSIARARGVELSIQKEGRLSGTLNYTFSRSKRRTLSDFETLQINDNNFFAYNYDRPHDLKVNTSYNISKRHILSFNFNLTSGRPLTIPSEKFVVDGITATNFSNRNSFRMPIYHRLDMSLLIQPNHKNNKIWEGSWVITIYNVYARKNAYSIFFENRNGVTQANKLSVLGTILPSITYNFKF